MDAGASGESPPERGGVPRRRRRRDRNDQMIEAHSLPAHLFPTFLTGTIIQQLFSSMYTYYATSNMTSYLHTKFVSVRQIKQNVCT